MPEAAPTGSSWSQQKIRDRLEEALDAYKHALEAPPCPAERPGDFHSVDFTAFPAVTYYERPVERGGPIPDFTCFDGVTDYHPVGSHQVGQSSHDDSPESRWHCTNVLYKAHMVFMNRWVEPIYQWLLDDLSPRWVVYPEMEKTLDAMLRGNVRGTYSLLMSQHDVRTLMSPSVAGNEYHGPVQINNSPGNTQTN
jgi:hypothetical protein